jgi:Gas vesicle synthesis protein GvpL/GvpF
MTVLLYGFAAVDDDDALAPVSPGVRHVRRGGLSAVVADAQSGKRAVSPAQFDEVLRALMARHPVLPARYDTVLAGDEEVRGLLAKHGPALAQSLERVRGASELALRALWADGAGNGSPGRGESGTAYLLGRRELVHRAQRVADGLEPLAGLARAVRTWTLPQPELALRASYLVDDERIADFADAVRGLDTSIEDAALVCTGPWPAYSFTGELN